MHSSGHEYVYEYITSNHRAQTPKARRAPWNLDLLVDFSKPGEAWSVLAYGQTTKPDSPHSSDQLQLFADHKLRRAWYSEADIKANLRREYRPQ